MGKMMTGKYRIIVVLSALACLVAILLAAGYKRFPFTLTRDVSHRPVYLAVEPLGTVNKPLCITRTGSTENSASVPVNAGFSGLLSEIYVKNGQVVKAGQPLMVIQVSSEPAASQAAESTPQTQADYDNALKEYNRYQKLFEIGAISRRQLDIAAARLQEAKERPAKTRSSSSGAPVNGPVTISAPTDGIVTGLTTAPGKAVQAGQQLLSLGSGQEVEVVVGLSQNDLYLVHLGTPAAIEAAQQTITGQVSRIYPQVEASQTPSFLAHIKLIDNPAGFLKPGMSVNVRIDTGRLAVVPAVPTVSIFQDGLGRNFVYLAINGKALIHQINIGETIGDFTEITSDLPEQSLVVTSNLESLKDGDDITVIQ